MAPLPRNRRSTEWALLLAVSTLLTAGRPGCVLQAHKLQLDRAKVLVQYGVVDSSQMLSVCCPTAALCRVLSPAAAEYSSETGKVLVQYEDGDEEWLDLAAERYQWVDRSQQAQQGKQQGKAKQAAKRQGGGGKGAAKGGAAGRIGTPEGMPAFGSTLRRCAAWLCASPCVACTCHGSCCSEPEPVAWTHAAPTFSRRAQAQGGSG